MASAAFRATWSETAPSWVIEGTGSVSHSDDSIQEETVRVEGTTKDLVDTLAEAIDELALRLDCHPSNISVVVKIRSADVVLVNRRFGRLPT